MRVADKIAEHFVPPGGVAIWWLGQNSYLLKGPATSVMIDPFFSRPGPPKRYVHEEAPLRADEFGPDAVFCTHTHYDHTDPAFLCCLARRWPQTRFFGPPESVREMLDAGIPAERVKAVKHGEEVRVGDASVGVVLSKTAEVSDVAHYGYIVDFGCGRVYNTGDIMRGVTREPSLMEPLRRAAPDVVLATTSPVEEEFPDFREAAELALAIGARVAIPAHYDCFADRTFDPSPFAAHFRDPHAARAEIIPYCGCYLHSFDSGSAGSSTGAREP